MAQDNFKQIGKRLYTNTFLSLYLCLQQSPQAPYFQPKLLKILYLFQHQVHLEAVLLSVDELLDFLEPIGTSMLHVMFSFVVTLIFDLGTCTFAVIQLLLFFVG